MIVYPNAKINLGLNIIARRPDGYHDIETIFYPIPLQDALEVEEAPRLSFRLAGTQLDCSAGDNLVIRVLQMLEADFTIPELDIFLYKHIPSGAGLGGGSSDAAFMMRLLNDKFKLGLTDEQMEERLSTLGADCPFFVRNRPVFATGIGNEFSPIELDLSGWTLLLVKPDIHVSTRDAYASVQPSKPALSLKEIVRRPIEEWKELMVNDFEVSVFPRYPEIAAIKDLLLDQGAVYAAMSGSGSAVYGLFRTPLEHPDETFAGCFVRQRQL
ncbi:MAG: 4-(cytidine 5'-diphospho)-2-C-methyl-D-erythritol kinase [Bacteroidaceae bacterium]|nr:4-(cytidine 5'-diphospho)-2-C-methyl-D-erythritol kinase [Bacteroidaceae bacterium]